jgi:hypothetical protein
LNADVCSGKKINFSQHCLNHLHHQLALSLRDPHGAFGKTCGDCLRCEIRTPLTLRGFQISKSSDRFANVAVISDGRTATRWPLRSGCRGKVCMPALQAPMAQYRHYRAVRAQHD